VDRRAEPVSLPADPRAEAVSLPADPRAEPPTLPADPRAEPPPLRGAGPDPARPPPDAGDPSPGAAVRGAAVRPSVRAGRAGLDPPVGASPVRWARAREPLPEPPPRAPMRPGGGAPPDGLPEPPLDPSAERRAGAPAPVVGASPRRAPVRGADVRDALPDAPPGLNLAESELPAGVRAAP
jgi:hypothetical protein